MQRVVYVFVFTKTATKRRKNSGRDTEFLNVLSGLNESLYAHFLKIEPSITCNLDYSGLFDFLWRFPSYWLSIQAHLYEAGSQSYFQPNENSRGAFSTKRPSRITIKMAESKQLAVNAQNCHQARENVGNHVPSTYWLRAQWREFTAPNTKSRKARDNQSKMLFKIKA